MSKKDLEQVRKELVECRTKIPGWEAEANRYKEMSLDVRAETQVVEIAKLAWLVRFNKIDNAGLNFFIGIFLENVGSMGELEALVAGI